MNVFKKWNEKRKCKYDSLSPYDKLNSEIRSLDFYQGITLFLILALSICLVRFGIELI